MSTFMMPHSNSLQSSISSHRPKHQVRRSITEFSAPIHLHRPGHTHRRNRSRDERTPAEPQSAGALLVNPLEVSKSEGVTPNLSPNQSRRASVHLGIDENGVLAGLPGYLGGKTKNAEAELALEEERAAARAAGLKQSYADLSSLSVARAQHLDETYHSILDKLGVLSGIISALRELASSADDTNATFSEESQELVTDVTKQLDGLGDFSDQRRRIAALAERIRAGRGRIQALSRRVDAVQTRVEGWERADQEWQERTRKRLKTLWIIMSTAVFILIALYVGTQYGPSGLTGLESLEEATARFSNESMAGHKNASSAIKEGPWDAGESYAGPSPTFLSRSAATAATTASIGDDKSKTIPDSKQALRALDEL